MVFGQVASKVAQLAAGTIGLLSRRWCTNPNNILMASYLLFTTVSCRFQLIPYSNRIDFAFSFDPWDNLSWDSSTWESFIMGLFGDDKDVFVGPRYPLVVSLPIVINIIQALSDGLRFQHDCKVSIYDPDHKSGSLQGLVPSRYGKVKKQQQTGFSFIERFRPKYNTHHFDGLNWEVTFVTSWLKNAAYGHKGKLVLPAGLLYYRTDEELAFTIGHEVGHGVALHIPPNPFAVWTCTWPIVGPLVYLWFSKYIERSRELEADYIGLMLMASAGYDPREAPKFLQATDVWHNDDDFLKNIKWMFSTHPPDDVRARRLSQAKVMDKAVKIYEQVQAGLGVPSFV